MFFGRLWDFKKKIETQIFSSVCEIGVEWASDLPTSISRSLEAVSNVFMIFILSFSEKTKSLILHEFESAIRDIRNFDRT